MQPIFKKEFRLNFNQKEILILGGNGAGKTSFLRLIKSLSSFNFSELFSKSCSSTHEREIDFEYEVQLRQQSLKVFFQETSLKPSRKLLSNKLLQDAIDSTAKDIAVVSKRNIKIETSGTNYNIRLLVDDKQFSFFLNEELINQSDLLEINLSSSNPAPTITDILLHAWSQSRKNDESDNPTAGAIGNILDLIMFFNDDATESNHPIFNEDKNYFERLLKESQLIHKKNSNSPGWYYTSGPWFIDTIGAPENSKEHWLLKKLNDCIEKDNPLLIIQSADLPILKRIALDLNVSDIKFNIFLNNKQKKEDGSIDSNWALNSITIVDHENNEFDSENLSYGQKRYLSLMIYLSKNSSYRPFLIDEPTNGLHHRFIESFYYNTEKSSQLFMTTQSPWLLNYIEIDNQEEALSKFVICKKENNFFTWRNFNKSEVKIILNSRENGIQKMDEILRTRGIW